jgi:hypothetical protein
MTTTPTSNQVCARCLKTYGEHYGKHCHPAPVNGFQPSPQFMLLEPYIATVARGMPARGVAAPVKKPSGQVPPFRPTTQEPTQSADDTQVGGTHYKDMAMQPWTVMQAVLTPEEFRGFLKGNLIKYAMRAGVSGSDDAGKAGHYQQKLKEVAP